MNGQRRALAMRLNTLRGDHSRSRRLQGLVEPDTNEDSDLPLSLQAARRSEGRAPRHARGTGHQPDDFDVEE